MRKNHILGPARHNRQHEPPARGTRHIVEERTRAMPAAPRMERQMFTKSIGAGTTEPSYFNFIMTTKSRRSAAPFAQAAGLLPELRRDYRVAQTGRVRAN